MFQYFNISTSSAIRSNHAVMSSTVVQFSFYSPQLKGGISSLGRDRLGVWGSVNNLRGGTSILDETFPQNSSKIYTDSCRGFSRENTSFPEVMKICNAVVEYRMNNFIVGLTNISPNSVAPFNGSYSLCGQWPGAAKTAPMPVMCQAGLSPARYVVIIVMVSVDQMNFAELTVYGTGAN